MPSFSAWQLSDVTFSGSPFASNSLASLLDVGTTFEINGGALPQLLSITDGDTSFEDGDLSQDLSTGTTFNGTFYGSGSAIHTEYSYIIRPDGGAGDGSDDITVYAVEISGDVEGFVADGFMQPGVTYTIIAIDDQSPTVPYSSLYVCFRAGTLISTAKGLRPVEGLVAGDRLQTLDNGYQPILWIGQSDVPGLGAMAPVRFETGVLGNDRPLFVSPQHRILLGESTLIARAMVGQPGISSMALPHVRYVHLLMERHELLLSEGLFSESFNPGPFGLSAIDAQEAREVLALSGHAVAPSGLLLPPVRPILKPGQIERFELSEMMRLAG